jgi:3-oxoacyl-[acyl-carrier-protein] synthase II
MSVTARPRVVVTGLGVKTPAGQTVDELWENLLAAKTMAAPVTQFDHTGHSVTIACEVRDFDPEPYVGAKEVRRTDRAALLAVAAAADAIADANGAPGSGITFADD